MGQGTIDAVGEIRHGRDQQPSGASLAKAERRVWAFGNHASSPTTFVVTAVMMCCGRMRAFTPARHSANALSRSPARPARWSPPPPRVRGSPPKTPVLARSGLPQRLVQGPRTQDELLPVVLECVQSGRLWHVAHSVAAGLHPSSLHRHVRRSPRPVARLPQY